MSKHEIAPRANERVRLFAHLRDPNVTFKQKMSHFWHYYRWYVIGTVVLLLIFGIFVHHTTSQVRSDAVVLYAGPAQLDHYQINELNRALSSVMSTGFRHYESRVVRMTHFLLMSEQQMNDMRAEYIAAGNEPPAFWGMSERFHQFNHEMMTGQSVILLLDPHIFELQRGMRRLASLELIFGEGQVPDIACCNYGIRLSDTEFAQNFRAFDVLPEDTILSIKAPVITMPRGFYNHQRQFFRDIVNFKRSD